VIPAISNGDAVGLRPSSRLLFILTLAFAGACGAGEPLWIESVQTNQRYTIGTLKRYAFVYLDRDFVFTEVPSCLAGQRYVVTANSDKFSRGPGHLQIQSATPMVVYVGYDRRYGTRPRWLEERQFRIVPNLQLSFGQPKLGRTQVTYDLYRATYTPGRIELGGNLSDREKSNYAMYTVVLVEGSQDRCR